MSVCLSVNRGLRTAHTVDKQQNTHAIGVYKACVSSPSPLRTEGEAGAQTGIHINNGTWAFVAFIFTVTSQRCEVWLTKMIFFKRFPLSKNHALSHKGSDKDKEKPKNSKQYRLNFYSPRQNNYFSPTKDKMGMDRFMDKIEKRLSGKGVAHTNSKGDPFFNEPPLLFVIYLFTMPQFLQQWVPYILKLNR